MLMPRCAETADAIGLEALLEDTNKPQVQRCGSTLCSRARKGWHLLFLLKVELQFKKMGLAVLVGVEEKRPETVDGGKEKVRSAATKSGQAFR